MKAMIIEKAGGIENLLLTETAKPEISENEVLVETRAISINPVDTKIKYDDEGLTQIITAERPITLGWDIAGTVIATGANVTQFKKGDKVFGMVNFPGHGKAYAEYVASPADHLAKIPDNCSFDEAAATTLAALTALQGLKGAVKSGDKVLIHAGSGGVGHFAVQIAKTMGAYVVATSSAKNREFVLSLGADEHIDYHTQSFDETLSGFDLVFDTVSPEIAEKSLKVLKQGGKLVSITILMAVDEINALAQPLDIVVNAFLVQSNQDDIQTLKDMLKAGSVKPHISKTYNFNAIGEAHTSIEAGRTVGKVIISL